MTPDPLRLPAVAALAADEALLVVGRDGAIRWCNPAFTHQFGYGPTDLVGRDVRVLGGDPVSPRLAEAWQAASEGREWQGEIPIARADRTSQTLACHCTPIHPEGDDPCVVVAWRDLDERHRLERRLRHSTRLELVGRLASGVAHDFNNLLTAILGYSRMVLDGLSPDDRRYEDLLEVHHAGERASALTRQLLAFSRHQIVNVMRVDLSATVDGVRRLARRILRENIVLSLELHRTPLWVDVDEHQLEEILLSLVVHAGDLLRDGGTIRVRTARAQVSGGHMAQLEVIGVGTFSRPPVAEADAPAPLASVEALVRQNGGHLVQDPLPGGGTRYAVMLPLKGARSVDPERQRADAARHRGTETILIVDDDAAVRTLVERVLKNFGYQAVTADGHEQAERVFREGGRHIDLLLTDMVMPGKGGEALARSLVASNPGLKVVFMSGYADQMPQAGIGGDDPVLLPKPFSPDTLGATVRRVLDGQNPPKA